MQKVQVKSFVKKNYFVRSLNADLKASRDEYAAGSTGSWFQSRMVQGK